MIANRDVPGDVAVYQAPSLSGRDGLGNQSINKSSCCVLFVLVEMSFHYTTHTTLNLQRFFS